MPTIDDAVAPESPAPVETPEVIERPVFDADAEPESAKNRRIAAELFKDDEPEATPPAAKPTLPSPPAQRRREEAAGAPKVDAMGRAHRADGTVMSRAEQAAAAAPAPAPVSEAPVRAPSPMDAPNEPLAFTAYGEMVSIPGALYKPGHGVFIPEGQLPELRRAWARGTKGYDTLSEQNARLRESTGQLYTRKEAEADAVISVIGPIFQTPQQLQAFAQQVLTDPALASERLQLALGRKQLELERNVQTPESVSDTAPDEGEIAEAMSDELTTFLRDPQFGLAGRFTSAQQREIETLAHQRAAQFLTTVDRDLDEHGNPVVSAQQTVVVRKGEVLVNRAKLLAELRFVADHVGPGAGTPAARPVGSAPAGNGAAQSVAPASPRPAPPSAVGRSRAQVPTASPPGTGRRTKDTIPNHSIAAAAKFLFDDD